MAPADRPVEQFFPSLAPPAFARTPAVDQFYISGEDNLHVTVYSRFPATLTITITWRFHRESDGSIQVNQRALQSATYPTPSTHTFRLDRGVLLNIRATVEDLGGAFYGQVYVLARVVRGLSGAIVPLATILQGYITTDNERGWPGSPLQGMHEGPGALRAADPADLTGPLEVNLTVPNNVRWRIVSGSAVYTASAVAGDRTLLLLVFAEAANVCFSDALVTPITAGQTARVSFSAGLPRAGLGVNLDQRFAFPADVELPSQAAISIQAFGTQAGDTFIGDRVLVREWMAV